jgi:hypothetical protein
MKVFISWSGERSKAVAGILTDWLKCVIQASQPWISTRDIDRGALWFSEINDQLKDVSIGIVCLTNDNKDNPWILFESGALAKGLTTSRVCPLLIDLMPEDVRDPLAQFNLTLPNKDGVWQLVKTVNSCLGEKMLDERILSQVFNTYWPQFEINFNSALAENPPTGDVPNRTQEDILSEILNTTRGFSQRIRHLESQSEYVPIRDRHKKFKGIQTALSGFSEEDLKKFDAIAAGKSLSVENFSVADSVTQKLSEMLDAERD